MKNLVWAVLGLIVVVIVVFVFFYKKAGIDDIVIPSPVSSATASPDISGLGKEAKEQDKMTLPFNLLKKEDIENKKVRISTNKGDILIKLSSDAPIASSNFISLVNKKFYDGVVFHRVIKGFMIQGGDPHGIGTGGPGYTFADELDPNTNSYKGGYARGVVAMANAGPNTNGSQFFIMHQNYQLPHSYTIFGNVLEGLDVVDEIANSQVDENDKPIESVVMKSVRLE